MYIGKLHDGFSYSINTILRYAGFSYNSEPDLCSQRLTLFVYHNDRKQWFQPRLHWKEYMARFLEYTGIREDHILAPASKELLDTISADCLFMLGNACTPTWDQTVIDRVCSDSHAFLLCKKCKNGYTVSNPLGCISMPCTSDHIFSMIDPDETFVFALPHTSVPVQKPKRAFIQELYPLLKQYDIAVQIKESQDYPRGVKDKIAFQNGLIQYVQARIRLSDHLSLEDPVREAFAQIRFDDEAHVLSQIIVAETIFLSHTESLYRKR